MEQSNSITALKIASEINLRFPAKLVRVLRLVCRELRNNSYFDDVYEIFFGDPMPVRNKYGPKFSILWADIAENFSKLRWDLIYKSPPFCSFFNKNYPILYTRDIIKRYGVNVGGLWTFNAYCSPNFELCILHALLKSRSAGLVIYMVRNLHPSMWRSILFTATNGEIYFGGIRVKLLSKKWVYFWVERANPKYKFDKNLIL